MFGFDSKNVFLVVPMFFCFEMEKTKTLLFWLFEWIWSIKISKKKNKT